MRSLLLSSFLLLSLCLMPVVAAAQPVPNPLTAGAAAPLTAAQAVALAIQNNPRLSAAAHDVRSARQGAQAARALANPQIVIAPALTGVGSDTEALVQQPLEINGTRAARAGAAQARLRATIADSMTALRDLVFDTRTAYYELIRAREQLALARTVLQASQEFDRLTRQQVELGSRPAIEQTQSGIEVIRARQQVTLAQSQADRSLIALNTVMGRDPAQGVDALAPLPTAFTPLDANAALRQALTSRTEIAAADASAEALRQDARQARAEGLPDLAPQYRATTITHGVHDSGFGIALTLPLLDYGSRRGRVRQDDEAARAQVDRVVAVRAQIRQEVEQAVTQAQAADTVLADYPQGLLAQAQSLLDASRIGYQEGRTSVLSLLDAQRTYRAVQSDYINAQVNAALARSELERATGAFPATSLTEMTK